MSSIIDSEEIIEARVRGESARSIAKRLGCTIDDINDVLDRFATQTITNKLRTHTLALELERLDGLQRVFEKQAKAGDVASGHLVTKIIELRAIMLGISAPARVEVIEMQAAAQPTQNSTERIMSVINRIRAARDPNGGNRQTEPPTNGESPAN